MRGNEERAARWTPERIRGDGVWLGGRLHDRRLLPATAAALCLATLAIGWPGVSQYDTVSQFGQVLSGVYEDWHPPIMARLWSVLHPLGPGAAPMFVLQVMLYWLGLGLIAGGLARAQRPRAGWVVLAIGALPLFAGWQIVVLKDGQMLGSLLAAVGLVAWWRLAGRRVPMLAVAGVIVLLGYAMLVRTNGVFAVVPLGVMLLARPAAPWRRTGAIVVLAGVVLAVSPAINHRLFGAQAGSVTHTLPIFDSAGIAQFGGADGVLRPDERALIVQRHCYKPFFWDPLGDTRHCGRIAARLSSVPTSVLNHAWFSAILRHPIAYAGHRLAHVNSTERWLVPANWPIAAPPAESEPNALGLASPGAAAHCIAAAGAWLVETPLGWPIVWLVLAVWITVLALRRPHSPFRDLALAITVSTLSIEASFAVFSIASDLRYHLWPMLGSALAAVVLLAERRPSRREAWALGIALSVVLASGTTARLILPAAPSDYNAMLGWDGGAGQAAAVARHPR